MTAMRMHRYRQHLILGLLVLFASGAGWAGSFDNDYEVRQRDVDGDGLLDLYVGENPRVIILHGESATPIVPRPSVPGLVLLQQGDASFAIHSALTAAERTTVSGWPATNIDAVAAESAALVSGAPDVFGKGATRTEDTAEAVQELHARIGQLRTENEFLERGLERIHGPRGKKW